ncbi:MAG TPA: flagellar basal body-associated FliL family protein [Paralcaligenes sp.]|jgi:flagellar FliL protein
MPPIAHSPFRKAITNILTVLIVMMGSVGATVFYMSHSDQPADAAKKNPTQKNAAKSPSSVPAPIFVELEPFTVTLDGESGSRILYAAITLRVEDDASRKLLASYMPEVRDRVLLLLSEQDAAVVQKPKIRQQLAQELIKALEAVYKPQPKQPKITSVLFTAFVVQ